MDLVYSLVHVKRFFKYTYEEKIELKNKGRPLPDVVIETAGVSHGKAYKRRFNREIYSRNNWICGCNKKNALFCFPCLLFGGAKAWTEVGVTDLVHLTEKIKNHDNSKTHIHNTMELTTLGTPNIRAQLDSAYWINVQKHNENVTKNRYVLSKIINCIKYCEAFTLVLRGYDEIDTSQNLGIFRGLIHVSAELDATLSKHIQNASVFKGTSKEIQNDILDCILEVCHEEIISEIDKASFLAVMVNEITDVSAESKLVVVLRYTLDGEPIERFWKYLNPAKCDAETLSVNIFSVVDSIVENSPYKLISQSYDGAAVISGQCTGVQAKIKQKYPCAHFMHGYGHQLNFMSKVASINSQVRVFFANLKEVPAFFKNFNSPQRIEVLNEIMGRKMPQGAKTCWNFNIGTINVVFENRDSLIECMEEIEEQFSNEAICSATSSIRRMLEDSVFVFWLTFFHHVMPHVDILFNQLQKRKTDSSQVKNDIDDFEKSIIHIRNNIDDIITEATNVCAEPREKKRKCSPNSRFHHRIAALEVCDLLANYAKDRFMSKYHLLAASLFFSEHFGEYCGKFPDDLLTTTCLAYPTLDKERLRTELSVIYLRNDCRELNGALPFLKFLTHNRLEETLRETKKLLEIIATTPMSTSGAEQQSFSTLKRIKTFLQNSMSQESQDRLTVLSMLSVEKLFISKIDSFNEKVIEKFASRKDYGVELIFKKDSQSTQNQGKSKMLYHEFQGCLGIKSEELNIKEEYDEYDRNGNNGLSSIYSHVIHSDDTEIKPFVDKSCNLETSHSTIKSDPC